MGFFKTVLAKNRLNNFMESFLSKYQNLTDLNINDESLRNIKTNLKTVIADKWNVTGYPEYDDNSERSIKLREYLSSDNKVWYPILGKKSHLDGGLAGVIVEFAVTEQIEDDAGRYNKNTFWKDVSKRIEKTNFSEKIKYGTFPTLKNFASGSAKELPPGWDIFALSSLSRSKHRHVSLLYVR